MIDENFIHALRNWYFSYFDGFLSGIDDVNKNFVHKKNHTLRVVDEISELGEAEVKSNELRNLAVIAALFHDLGRFEQFSKYNTFADSKSENHASLSVEIMKRENVLDGLDDTQIEIIYQSILNHNLPALPPTKNPKVETVSKLLRDADKMDNFFIIVRDRERLAKEKKQTYYFGLPLSAGFTESILSKLINGEVVPYSEAENVNDFNLLQLGWIYDLNFKTSFYRIKERDYIDRFRAFLPEHQLIEKYLKLILAYIDSKL